MRKIMLRFISTNLELNVIVHLPNRNKVMPIRRSLTDFDPVFSIILSKQKHIKFFCGAQQF